jgi:hypothetical protein
MAAFQKPPRHCTVDSCAGLEDRTTFTPACASFAANSAPETPDPTMITSASISAMAMRQA